MLWCRFAIAWYPIYRIPDAPLSARFITFHHVQPQRLPPQPSASQSELGLPVVGLSWCDSKQENWLERTPIAQDDHGAGSPASRDTFEEDEAAFGLDQHLEELQAAAKQMGNGIGLKFLGPQGFKPIPNQRHPDLAFFQTRPS